MRDNNTPLVSYGSSQRQLWYQKSWFRWAVAAAVLVMICAASALPAYRAWKLWRAHRIASAAEMLMRSNELQKAYPFIQQADHYAPNDAAVQRIKGHFLFRARAFAPSIGVWDRMLRGKQTLLPVDRRDYAMAAYEMGRFQMVAEQLRILRELVPGGSPTDSLLAARLAERVGDRPEAVKNALQALGFAQASDSERYDAAMVLLTNAPEVEARHTAWETLNRLAAGRNAVGLQSLAFLATQQLTPSVNTAGRDGLAADIRGLIEALETHPLSTIAVRLGVLELRYKLDPARSQELVNKAIDEYKNSDDNNVTALCRWLLSHQGSAEVLKILPLDRARNSRPLLTSRMEALAAAREWGIVEKDLGDPAVSGKLDDPLTALYLARSAIRLGKPVAAEVNWDRALAVAAGDRRKLLIVGSVAEIEHQSDRAEAAYRAAAAVAPPDVAAYAPLLRFLSDHGGAGPTHQVLLAMAKQWPDDVTIRTSEIYVGLLAGQATPENARETVDRLLKDFPANASLRAVRALAMLRQDLPDSALRSLGEPFDPGPPGTAQPSLVVHAAALAAVGRMEEARQEAVGLAGSRRLLPEERAMLQPLLVNANASADAAAPAQ